MKYTEGKTKTNTKPPAKTPRPSINPAPQKPVDEQHSLKPPQSSLSSHVCCD